MSAARFQWLGEGPCSEPGASAAEKHDKIILYRAGSARTEREHASAGHALLAGSQSESAGSPREARRPGRQPLVQLGSSDARAVRAACISRCGTRLAVIPGRSSGGSTSADWSTRPTIRFSSPASSARLPRTTPTFDRARGARSLQALRGDDLIAYFCAEFGFHESLPIYSGGLGILAGDHCKAASDMGVPLVGDRPALPPGLFLPDHRRRRQSRRRRTPTPTSRSCRSSWCSDRGRRRSARERRAAGAQRRVAGLAARASATSSSSCSIPTCPENGERDRGITLSALRRRSDHAHRAGDRARRRRRARARALGLKPTVWHMNEGHAAFLVLERVRVLRQAGPRFRERAGGGRGQHRLHHPHRGAGGTRPLSPTKCWRATSRATRASSASTMTRCSRSAARPRSTIST